MKIQVFSVLLLCTTVKGCIFKPVTEKPENQLNQFPSVNEKTLIRRPSPHPCICGEDDHPDKTPGQNDNDTTTVTKDEKSHRNQKWILYIRMAAPDTQTKLCVGTIVNSNMVITSHRCLQKQESISVADVFHSKQGLSSSLATTEDITLSSELDLSSPTNQIFPVKKIIYSERFAYDHTYDQVPESDVAILVVDIDFTKSETKNSSSPICVPRYGEISTKEIINREGHYQGIHSREGTDTYFNLGTHSYSRIATAEDCNEQGGMGVKPKHNETLCLVFTFPGPTIEGGPLGMVVKRFIDGSPRRSFLLGLSNWVEKAPTNATYNYAYFENINSIVNYIEHQSSLHDSTWCPTPHPDDQKWPWESLSAPFPHDHSLDCECGRQDWGGSLGRIVGGVNVSLGEFPWTVNLLITFKQANENVAKNRILCGGSIINDRMILTAAQCFVSAEKLFQTDSFNLDYHPNQVNFTEIYVRAITLNPYRPEPGADVLKNIFSARVFAKKILYHPGYVDEARESRADFDIALIILNDTLTLGKATKEHGRIDPVCLPPKKDYLSGLIVPDLFVTGVGADSFDDEKAKYSSIVKKLLLHVFPLEVCLKTDRVDLNITTQLPTDTKFCGKNYNDTFFKYNAANGDTGGPIIHLTKDIDGSYVQVGIFSYHNYNASSEDSTTAYYTNVGAFLPYIYYYSNKYGARFCQTKN